MLHDRPDAHAGPARRGRRTASARPDPRSTAIPSGPARCRPAAGCTRTCRPVGSAGGFRGRTARAGPTGCGCLPPPHRTVHAVVEIEIRRARRVEIILQLATFPEAPLRSRTVGFPESGSGLGSARHFSGRATKVPEFNRSSQRLHERSCHGSTATEVGSGRSSSDALAGSSVGGASRGAPAVLGRDRSWCVQPGRGWRGWCVSCGWCPVVSRGWWDAHCHPGPAVGALPVTC